MNNNSTELITDEKLQTTIYNQQTEGKFEKLCPVKEEMIILGYYLNEERYHSYFHTNVFSTYNVKTLWRKIEDSKLKINEEELRLTCQQDFDNEKLDIFIKASKQLAQNITEEEYIRIFNKVEKMYWIRDLCEDMYDKIHSDSEESKEEKFFLNRVSLLANSKRIETLSLNQIKKFLKPINISNMLDIADSETSLTKDLTSFLTSKIGNPDEGVDLAFPLMTKAINGLKKGQLLATGMFSNNGKTRLMIRNIADLVLKHNEKVLIISNEMTKDDIRYCFITTVINNPEFKEMFDITDISKNERDIRNGIYKDSTEFNKIISVVKEIEEKLVNNVFIIHTDSYSDEVLTEIILRYYMNYEIDYFFYDTLKADKTGMSNWDGLKVTTTILSELAKNYNMCIWCSIQLIDDSRYDTSPLALNYKNIANSKQVYHVLDTLFLFSPIDKKDYKQYAYWEDSKNPSKETIKELDNNTTYYICRISKNRLGAKPDLLFKVNLNKNTWEELGQVCYREKVKELLNG